MHTSSPRTNASKQISCGAAGAPIVRDRFFVVKNATAAGTIINPFNHIDGVTTGSQDANRYWQSVNIANVNGCQWWIARVEFAQMGDCNPCTNPDAVTLNYEYFVISPGGARVISPPNARIVDVELKAADKPSYGLMTAGNWTAASAVVTEDAEFFFYSELGTSPCCDAMPATTNTRGIAIVGSKYDSDN